MANLPYEFVAGDVAASGEVNANFNYIVSLFGDLSNPNQLAPPEGTIQFGDRAQAAAKTNQQLHIGWNAESYLDGGQAKIRRYVNGQMATFLRLSGDGFGVWSTKETSGDLASQAVEVFGVHPGTTENAMYMNPNWRISQKRDGTGKAEEYRTTYVAYSAPKTLYEDQWKGAGSQTWNMFDFGVPPEAIAVELVVYATATSASGAAVHMKRAEQTSHFKTGFICHAYGGTAVPYGCAAAQGKVLLGTGSYKGKITETRTASFTTCSIYLQGYYI